MLGKITAKGIKVTPESIQAMKKLGQGKLPEEQAAFPEFGPTAPLNPAASALASAVPAEEKVPEESVIC